MSIGKAFIRSLKKKKSVPSVDRVVGFKLTIR